MLHQHTPLTGILHPRSTKYHIWEIIIIQHYYLILDTPHSNIFQSKNMKSYGTDAIVHVFWVMKAYANSSHILPLIYLPIS